MNKPQRAAVIAADAVLDYVARALGDEMNPSPELEGVSEAEVAKLIQTAIDENPKGGAR